MTRLQTKRKSPHRAENQTGPARAGGRPGGREKRKRLTRPPSVLFCARFATARPLPLPPARRQRSGGPAGGGDGRGGEGGEGRRTVPSGCVGNFNPRVASPSAAVRRRLPHLGAPATQRRAAIRAISHKRVSHGRSYI